MRILISNKLKNLVQNVYFVTNECNEQILAEEIKYGKQFEIQDYTQHTNTKSNTFNLNNKYSLDKYLICCDDYSYSKLGGKLTTLTFMKNNVLFYKRIRFSVLH